MHRLNKRSIKKKKEGPINLEFNKLPETKEVLVTLLLH